MKDEIRTILPCPKNKCPEVLERIKISSASGYVITDRTAFSLTVVDWEDTVDVEAAVELFKEDKIIPPVLDLPALIEGLIGLRKRLKTNKEKQEAKEIATLWINEYQKCSLKEKVFNQIV